MAVLPIRLFPDPVLRTVAEEVTSFDSDLEKLVRDMMDTMHDDQGVGLAAPQVGISKRIFVYDCGDGVKGHLVNPVWQQNGDATQVDTEGCLSVPGIYGEVERFTNVTVSGKDMYGKDVSYDASGLFARCIQHETDHLDGKMFMQAMTYENRKKAMAAIRQAAWFGKNIK